MSTKQSKPRNAPKPAPQKRKKSITVDTDDSDSASDFEDMIPLSQRMKGKNTKKAFVSPKGKNTKKAFVSPKRRTPSPKRFVKRTTVRCFGLCLTFPRGSMTRVICTNFSHHHTEASPCCQQSQPGQQRDPDRRQNQENDCEAAQSRAEKPRRETVWQKGMGKLCS